ncbi:MAG: DNA repair protein RecO [Burkholderiales bacterium]|nr:DNA repair protein RecO [Burkholderiales bacterium]ODU68952.1 MAG: DNA repair protein RecO [Lautropia sp. SCN 66-9]
MATSKSLEPAFLLHSTPYRETSLIVELFTREHGRVAAVAKGAKRPRSALRAVLLQFQPLNVSYVGQRELRLLTGAEWVGGVPAPLGDALLCAFYLNELLMRLLPREDAHPLLFDAYAQALVGLSDGASPLDETLRRFEWQLLRETGYAPDLERDAADRPIDAGLQYSWQPGDGFVACEPGGDGAVSGAMLSDLAAGRFDAGAGRQQAKYLTRAILSYHLDGAVLNTRQILIDLQKL